MRVGVGSCHDKPGLPRSRLSKPVIAPSYLILVFNFALHDKNGHSRGFTFNVLVR